MPSGVLPAQNRFLAAFKARIDKNLRLIGGLQMFLPQRGARKRKNSGLCGHEEFFQRIGFCGSMHIFAARIAAITPPECGGTTPLR